MLELDPTDHPKTALRVALVAGTLGKGGAEKQLVYTAQALRDAGARVRVFCLTQGEYHEQTLREAGLEPTWFGQSANPLRRAAALWQAARGFQPHVFQSTHFYTNIYAALAALPNHAVSFGAIRSSGNLELRFNRGWSRLMLNLPTAVIANSEMARANALQKGFPAGKLFVLPNVIDLASFDLAARRDVALPSSLAGPRSPVGLRVAHVARLIPVKRHDRFLRILALARWEEPSIQGILIGDGPERASLEAQAAALGLLENPPGVLFLGEQHEVPALLRCCDVLALTSDEEGFPNVVLEGMAAGLPVVTTPAGDAVTAVQENGTGFIVPWADEDGFAARLVQLARQPALRAGLGQAGRLRVEQVYSLQNLAPRLLAIYQQVAAQRGHPQVQRILERGRVV